MSIRRLKMKLSLIAVAMGIAFGLSPLGNSKLADFFILISEG